MSHVLTEPETFCTSACPQTAPTRSSAKPCTSLARAFGSRTLSESTKARISASVARMPAAMAARLPRFWAKSMTVTRPPASSATARISRERPVGRAVVDRDQLQLLGRVVQRQERAQAGGDRLLLVEAGHDDGDPGLDAAILGGSIREREGETRQDVDRHHQPVDAEVEVGRDLGDEQDLVGDDHGDDRHQVGADQQMQLADAPGTGRAGVLARQRVGGTSEGMQHRGHSEAAGFRTVGTVQASRWALRRRLRDPRGVPSDPPRGLCLDRRDRNLRPGDASSEIRLPGGPQAAKNAAMPPRGAAGDRPARRDRGGPA